VFIAEPMVGATLGAVPAVEGYFRRIREICDRYGIVLILDEVMCGMGRTGTLFAFEQEQVVPDIVCISKALGAGYQPIAATMISKKIWSALAAGSGVVEHFQTYQAHPVACAAALAVLKQITRPEMIEQVRTSGEYLMQLLHERIGDHPHVGDIRGRGLFVGVEFVRDRATKRRFASETRVNVAVRQEAMALGLTATGPIGSVNDCVLLSPPYIATRNEIAQMAELLCEAIERVVARPERARTASA
jgi:adenosylmethionine-8-amino-7-oxononanoate aminotransferase